MSVLQRLERRLEQAVSGAFARAFRSAVQPVEIAAALQREIDNSAQILSRDRRLAPNAFTVELSATDHDRLGPYAATLHAELAEILEDHAHQQRYVFAGPISIRLSREDDLGTGRFRVRSRAEATVEGRPRAPAARTDATAPSPAPGIPATRGAAAFVEVNGARHELTPPSLVVGRGGEADLRINDPGVSRRHAELRVEPGPQGPLVTVTDLGSTNGTLVDGRRVSTRSLYDGSVVRLGTTDLVVRLPPRGG